MKKIGIVSCYFQKNYGSILQAYATQKTLDEMGLENETICIDGLKKELKKAKLKYYIKQIINFRVINYKYGFVTKWFMSKLHRSFAKQLSIRNNMFDSFVKENFKISTVYNSRNELSNDSHNFSAFILGSDQLWLPSNIEADYYTLNFVPDEIRKITFATSFGVSMLPKAQNKKASKFLKRINFISVREKEGQKIVKQLTDREVPIVCDPTMLFSADEWSEINKSEGIIKYKYIFCYFLGDNSKHIDFAKKLKKLTGFKIVALQNLDVFVKKDKSFADISPYDIGPSEFLNLISNAEYVLTDSFHCSIFSILYRKPFFSFKRFSANNLMSTNCRLDSLFNLLHLGDRLINGDEDIKDCLGRKIDYDAVNIRIEKFRNQSKKYLKDALEAI